MIKARKRDIKALRELSADIDRGVKLLLSNRYELMRPTSSSSTDIFTASYYPGERYTKVRKEYGNDLVPMFTAVDKLVKVLSD